MLTQVTGKQIVHDSINCSLIILGDMLNPHQNQNGSADMVMYNSRFSALTSFQPSELFGFSMKLLDLITPAAYILYNLRLILIEVVCYNRVRPLSIEEEMSLWDMMTLLKLRKGEYSVVEEKVHPDSIASGKILSELPMPSECVVAAIIRKGKFLIPHGNTALEPADEIIAIVHTSQIAQLAAAFARI